MKNFRTAVFCIVIHIFNYEVTFSQDAMYSQTNYHQLIINPAYTGNSPYPRFMAGYRNQWPGINNAFVSYYISYDQYFKGISSNLGFSFHRDIEGGGVFNRTSGDIYYSYPVDLNQNTVLSLGVQAGVVQKNLNSSNLQLPSNSTYNPIPSEFETIPGRTKLFPDFSFGMAIYFGEQYLFGLSVHHINRPSESFNSGNNYSTPMELNMQFLAKYSFSKPRRGIEVVTLIPGVYAQFQKYLNFVTFGTNINYRGLITGIWIRNNLEAVLPTFIVHAGFSLSSMELVYSYDAWSPQNSQQFKIYGAHEVTFINHFKYNDPKRKMRTIKCPNFSR